MAIGSREFEDFARSAMSRHYGTALQPGRIPGIPKKFDLVSNDGRIVGDAKFYALVRGEQLPPAKFSGIAEYVWLIQKTQAPQQFLVFGNDRRVPEEWLKRYGHWRGTSTSSSSNQPANSIALEAKSAAVIC